MPKVKDGFDQMADSLLATLSRKLKGDGQTICVSNPTHPGGAWADNEYASPEWIKEKRIELGDMGGTHPEFRNRVLGQFVEPKPALCLPCKKELDAGSPGLSARLSKWYVDAEDAKGCTRCEGHSVGYIKRDHSSNEAATKYLGDTPGGE